MLPLSLRAQAIIGAYVVFVFMRSRARVRFSKNCLISRAPQEDEYLTLNFRLVRESYTQVRDSHIHVQARYTTPVEAVNDSFTVIGCKDRLADRRRSAQQSSSFLSRPYGGMRRRSSDRDRPKTGLGGQGVDGAHTDLFSAAAHAGAGRHGSGCSAASMSSAASTSTGASGQHGMIDRQRRAELALESEVMSTFDYWHVVHLIDEASPLWPLRHVLQQHLQSIEISLTAYDPYFSQPVKLYARYGKDEIIHSARFEQVSARRYRSHSCLQPILHGPPCHARGTSIPCEDREYIQHPCAAQLSVLT